MNKSAEISIYLILVVLNTTFSASSWVKFSTESLAEQESGVWCKRVESSYFGHMPLNSMQCVFACTIEDNCVSFYKHGEACVFGVDDVTAFEGGDAVIPDPSQLLRVKGNRCFEHYI